MTDLYLYVCEHCDHKEEVQLNIFSPVHKTCSKCSHQMERHSKELMEMLHVCSY
jgi:predicted nucleic acid-binding Zn ribbon protein